MLEKRTQKRRKKQQQQLNKREKEMLVKHNSHRLPAIYIYTNKYLSFVIDVVRFGMHVCMCLVIYFITHHHCFLVWYNIHFDCQSIWQWVSLSIYGRAH